MPHWKRTEPLDENGCLKNKRITCRHRDEIIEVDRERVDYVDISPRMMVSIATAMIPFLENDDANRALLYQSIYLVQYSVVVIS